MVKIAVENPFTDVRQALQSKGYQVDMINQAAEGVDYDVLVVRDAEKYDNLRFRGSLVDTSGRTIYDIVEEVEERLQRAGKIPGSPKAKATVATKVKTKTSMSSSRFTAGLLSGALIGSIAALLFAPKTGKEMQTVVKSKLPIGNSSSSSSDSESSTVSDVKEKATDVIDEAKEKANDAAEQMKNSSSGSNSSTTSGQTASNSSSAPVQPGKSTSNSPAAQQGKSNNQ